MLYVNNVIASNNRGQAGIKFQGSLHKSVQKIFTDLVSDIPVDKIIVKDVSVTADDVFKKLYDYIGKTNKHTELYWRKRNIFQRLFSSDRYEGFMFRNKVSKKEIRGSEYPNNVFAELIYHPSEKYINEFGVTAQAPEIKHREIITGHRSKLIDDLYDYCNEETCHVGAGYIVSHKKAPVVGFFAGMIKKIMAMIPKREICPYDTCDLSKLNRWVDQLTTHTTPDDVDKLLNIIK